MSIFISGNDATRIIRASRTGSFPALVHPGQSVPVQLPPLDLLKGKALDELYRLLRHPPDTPLVIRVPSTGERIRAPSIINRITSGELPPELVMYASQNDDRPLNRTAFGTQVMLDSPLMNLLMLADELDTHATAGSEQRRQTDMLVIDRICEYCGTYSLDPFAPNEHDAHYRLNPVLTLADIKSYLDRGGGKAHRGGFGRLRIAAKYAVERSASPSETLVALALTAMPRLGGFHLRGMRVNEPLDLDSFACDRDLLSHSRLTPDLYFPDINYAIEVQGSVHEKPDSQAEDLLRKHDYDKLGIEAVFSWAGEYASPSGISGLALEIASRIDRKNENDNQVNRVKRLIKDERFRYCQRLLFETLFQNRS